MVNRAILTLSYYLKILVKLLQCISKSREGPKKIFFVCLYIFACYRHSLFGGSSVKMIDADLSRLYTATSLMQIDDNIMRYVEKQFEIASSESHSCLCCFDRLDYRLLQLLDIFICI